MKSGADPEWILRGLVEPPFDEKIRFHGKFGYTHLTLYLIVLFYWSILLPVNVSEIAG